MTNKKNKDKAPQLITHGVVARNRRAKYDYTIDSTFEAGIVLTGTEVKSLRLGRANIAEAYVGEKDSTLQLLGARIEPWEGARFGVHDPLQARKILLHKREMMKYIGMIQQKGVTLIPMQLYFNKRGIAKLEIGLATGKKSYEKRDVIKDRDWQRQKARIMKHDV